MTTLRVVLVVLLSGCVVSTGRSRTEPVDPLAECMDTCSGCCDGDGLCRTGSSVTACGSRGTVCSACEGGEVCSFNGCRARPEASTTPARPPEAGDLTFRWRFAGQACAVVRDVSTVTLDIPGLSLPNAGVFACSSGAADGVTLSAVPPGFYRFTARGLTAGGAALYEQQGFVTVDGPVQKRIELAPVAGGTGRVLVSWRLPVVNASAEPCAAVGASQVAVQLSGRSTPFVARCDAGGLELSALPAGSTTVSLFALDSQGVVLASGQGTVQVLVGATVSSEFGLTWRVGGLALRWALSNMGLAQTCSQAGASQVFLNLRGTDGVFLYPDAGVAVPCEAGAAVFSLLPVGRYELFAQAVGGLGTLYRSSAATVQVLPGDFPTVSVNSPLLVLER
ncbi:MAG: hypothetical protein SFW67_30435 [Myxococcaceae bacterium]|nr:hypothetical protein [Myxococcaceae bacterium]